jgi:hypothetical protein
MTRANGGFVGNVDDSVAAVSSRTRSVQQATVEGIDLKMVTLGREPGPEPV